MDKALEETYKAIKRSCPSTMVDSFEVVKEVEAYRQFWKPNQVNIILLAESHVFSDQSDFKRELNHNYMQRLLPDYPSHFVRFVYCLGYGEDTLLDEVSGDRPNTGTPQFWKIFSYCAADDPNNPQDYKVLKTGTPEFTERIKNKIALLRKLKEKGIWLLDSSIVGLYGNTAKSDIRDYQRVIEFCWRYIESQILAANPKYVIIVGQGVSGIIESRLKVPHETINLPTAHQPAAELLRDYQRYSEVCNAILKGEPVQPRNGQPPKPEITTSRQVRTDSPVEQRLVILGYSGYAQVWRKGERVVQIVRSKEFGHKIRINWKDAWQNHYALVYDYSAGGGPVCVVPTKTLFETKFIREKRLTQAYANSGHQWSQPFLRDHELTRLILKHRDSWDLL